MRGTLFIIIIITLLIVGMLVIKDMRSENVDGVQKKEMVKKAEKTVKDAEKSIDKLQKKIKESY